MNKREIAEKFEISLTSLDGWIRRGCPVKTRGARGFAWDLDPAAIESWRKDRDGTSKQVHGDGDPSTLTAERTRKTRHEANIKEMQERQLSGELMERAIVSDEFVRRVYIVKSDLLNIEKKLMQWPAAKAIVVKQVRQILKNYSRPLPADWKIPKNGG